MEPRGPNTPAPLTEAPLTGDENSLRALPDSPPEGTGEAPPPGRRTWTVWLERLALPLVWIVVAGVFGAVEPNTFLTVGNLANIFGSNTVIFVVMLAALIPLVAGDFDLSVAATSGLASITVAILNVNHGVSLLLSCVAALGVGIAIGLVNAAIVVIFDNDSFIVTLGTGTVVTGIAFGVSGANTIAGLSQGLIQWVFINTLFGIPLEFYYGLAILVALWYAWEMTPTGQRILFVGVARPVARLSGIAVDRVRWISFILSGAVAGLSGILYVGTTGSADATTSESFLLPAFAAAFLGSTCIRPGRFNAFGGAVAVFFLSTGVAGLQLMGVQDYVQQLFYGGALVIAVTISQIVRLKSARG